MDKKSLDERFNQTRDLQRTFSYYLLAICGASIAYSFQLVYGQKLSWSMIPFVIAVTFWMISFYYGFYRNLNEIKALNMEFLKFYTNDGDNIKIESINRKETSIINNFDIQVKCILLGYSAFILWYIVEMIERTWGYCW